MSIQAMILVFETPFGSTQRKAVAIQLANHADADGRGIWPSVSTIAAAAEVSPRTVQRILSDFVDEGILIRRQMGGGRKTSRYDMDLDAVKRLGMARAANEGGERGRKPDKDESEQKNLPEGEGCQGDTGDNGALRGDTVSPLGCHGYGGTVNEPSITASMRESAQAREDEGEEGQEVEPLAPRPEALRRSFREAFATWPTFKSDPEGPAFKAWQELGEDERAEAARLIDTYVASVKATGRKHVCTFGRYLSERLWQRLDDSDRARVKDADAAKPSSDFAPGGGPVFNACALAMLFEGPDRQAVPVPDAKALCDELEYMAQFISVDRLDAALAARHMWQAEDGDFRFHEGWQDVNAARLTLEHGWKRQQRFAASRGAHLGPRWHGLKAVMEAVPAGSAVLAAWRAEFEARGWPWVFERDGLAVAWMPKLPDTDDALDERVRTALGLFAAKLGECGDTASGAMGDQVATSQQGANAGEGNGNDA